MKIVLDMQGAQGGSRFRGIGRYATALARAIAQAPRGHEVWVLLGARMADTVEALRAELQGLIPPERIRVFEAPGPLEERDSANLWRMQAAELLRESFLARLQPDIVHSMSMFEGLGNDVVCSVGRLHPELPSSTVLYDLIPFMRPDSYLQNPLVRRAYFRRIQAMRQCDLLLAISQDARRDGIRLLDLPPANVVNISAGVDAFFRPVALDDAGRAALLAQYGLAKPVVLYTGAVDPRKNVDGLLAAFALLPPAMRGAHQLGLVGRMEGAERAQIEAMARRHGVAAEEMVFLGYVPDADLRALYSACAVFVFPSLHEGFGLPALEAMACGAPTIGSNTTSIPEVIGRADAMFDPAQPAAIAERMQAVLGDGGFAAELRRTGLETAAGFTWQRSAGIALDAFEALHARRKPRPPVVAVPARPRPRLAVVAPLPPVKSGIAGYTARLLPELARHYDITCIIDQKQVQADAITATMPLRGMDWFIAHAGEFDRVLYQIGNAPFHRNMLPALARVPGVVMLHDFSLGGMLGWEARRGGEPGAYLEAVYRSHGYPALLMEPGEGAVLPANGAVLRDALRVLVHSRHAVDLARHWYGDGVANGLRQVQFLPHPHPAVPRQAARAALGVAEDDFLVCAFGALYPTKLNHRLLQAWLQSPLAQARACRLVFVGGHADPPYQQKVEAILREAGAGEGGARITVTGYADDETYARWLGACDAAVQLRADSRGETSGAIHECLARGVPLVVNDHGAAAELPQDAALHLPDRFADAELAAALARLYDDAALRARLSAAALAHADGLHHPARVADAYRDRIEDAYATSPGLEDMRLLRALADIQAPSPPAADLGAVAQAMVANRPRFGARQILFDVSALSRTKFVTGIERVTRAMLAELLRAAPPGWRVEPVRIEGDGYVYARAYTAGFLGLAQPPAPDERVEAAHGDLYLGIDWSADRIPHVQDWFAAQRRRGVKLVFMVYDILPLLRPEFFPAEIPPMVQRWLDAIGKVADGLVAISGTVQQETAAWLGAHLPQRLLPLPLGHVHLGADITATQGADMANAAAAEPDLEKALAARPTFLMVGTLEPRKGHALALAALEKIWAEGGEVNLVVVGRLGWMKALGGPLRSHAQAGQKLFWLERADDALLRRLYAESAALLALSDAEGFGLPLIEAAQHGLPVIARDIPVFREVAGSHAFYADGTDAAATAASLKAWLALHAEGRAPASSAMPWMSWAQSTAALLRLVLDDGWQAAWSPPDAH